MHQKTFTIWHSPYGIGSKNYRNGRQMRDDPSKDRSIRDRANVSLPQHYCAGSPAGNTSGRRAERRKFAHSARGARERESRFGTRCPQRPEHAGVNCRSAALVQTLYSSSWRNRDNSHSSVLSALPQSYFNPPAGIQCESVSSCAADSSLRRTRNASAKCALHTRPRPRSSTRRSVSRSRFAGAANAWEWERERCSRLQIS